MPTATAIALRLSCPRLGHVFTTDEPLTLHVAGPEGPATWRAIDAWGRRVASGAVTLREHETILQLPNQKPGYFVIELRHADGEIAPARTTIAVLTPYDVAAVDESPFGVMTHFSAAWEPDLIDVLAAVGIKHVRDELFWDKIEPRRGEYEFPGQFERFMWMLEHAGMSPLTPLSFGNPNYDATPGVPNWCAAPYTEDGFEGYARYAVQLLRHWGKQIRWFEVWNEYNGGFARGPADGRPEVYARMLAHAYRAVKAERPDVTVLGCSTIGLPLSWIEEVFRHGGLDHMDAVSVHPYGYRLQPEWLSEPLVALDQLIRRYNGGRPKPIYVTEQGYYLTRRGEAGNRAPISEHTKARYLVRAWTIMLAHGVAKSFWYLARNDDAFGTMGLVGKPDDPDGRYAPKPALVAYGTMIRQLTGSAFAQRDNVPAPLYSYRFDAGPRQVRVMWAIEPVCVTLACREVLRVVDLFGATATVQPHEGTVVLQLSDAPLYVHGEVTAVTGPMEPAVRGPVSLAEDEMLDVLACAQPVSAHVTPRCASSDEVVRLAGSDEDHWSGFHLERDGQVIGLGQVHVPAAPPITLQRVPRLATPDRLDLVIANHTTDRTFAIERLTWTLGDQHGHVDLHRPLQPGQRQVLAAAVAPVPPYRIVNVEARIDLQGHASLQLTGQVSYNVAPHRTITVDGDLGDWRDVPAIDLDHARYQKLLAQRSGPADLGGRIMLAWDEQHLYVAADITDDVFDQTHHGYNSWKGDNLQLGIAAIPPWLDGEWSQRYHEISLALTPLGPEVFRTGGPAGDGPVPGAALAVRRHAQSTVYEAALPWASLGIATPSTGCSISFAVYINDADGAGRKGFLAWGDIKSLDRLQPVHLRA